VTPLSVGGDTAWIGAVLAAVLSIGAPGTVRAQAAAAPGPAEAASPTDSILAAAAWLAGCWQVASPDGQNVAEEHWMAPRGGLMVGMSRSIRGGVARGYEILTIRVEDGGLVYHAEPSGQAPTDFPARLVEAARLEFVNAEHDFPQKVVYARVGKDNVEAAVFGEADGSEPAFVLPYERIRCPG
jgi:hypothetical protein